MGMTLARIPLVLLFSVLAVLHATVWKQSWLVNANLAILISAIACDWIDGYAARRFGATTKLGALADPFADKVFFLVSLPTLVFVAAASGSNRHAMYLAIFTAIFLCRDEWVSYLRSIGSRYGAEAAATMWGKLRTATAFVLVCLAYYREASGSQYVTYFILYALEGLVLALTFFSAVTYTRYYLPYLRQYLRTS